MKKIKCRQSPAVRLKEDMILERAQELVIGGWCQYGFAKTELGEDVWPDEEDAMAFCATGAVIRAMHELKIGVVDPLIDFDFNNPYYINVCQRLIEAIGPIFTDEDDCRDEHTYITVWNDLMMKSAEDVALVFKRALHDG